MPTGGVSRPIIRFSTMIRPKCTGSMPSLAMIGMNTGTRIVIAAIVSMKQPTNSRKMLASSRNTQRRVGDRQHPLRDRFGDLRRGQHPGEDRRAGDDEQHDRRRLDRLHRDLDQHPPVQRPVPDEAEKQRPGDGGDRGLGRREQARRHAADQDHRRQQRHERLELEHLVGDHRPAISGRPKRTRPPSDSVRATRESKAATAVNATIAPSLEERPAHPPPRERDVGAIFAHVRVVADHDHHEERHHRTRDEAAGEQLADRVLACTP